MTQTDARPSAPAIEDVLALSPLQQGLFSMATLTEGGVARTDPYVIAMAVDGEGGLLSGYIPVYLLCCQFLVTYVSNVREIL